jgi:hypothetical protein
MKMADPILEEPVDTIAEMNLEELAGPEVVVQKPVKPVLTPEKIRGIVADLINPEALGHVGIAQKYGVTTGQVKKVDKARLERIVELTAEADIGHVEPKEIK